MELVTKSSSINLIFLVKYYLFCLSNSIDPLVGGVKKEERLVNGVRLRKLNPL